jgi:hypothetical protein
LDVSRCYTVASCGSGRTRSAGGTAWWLKWLNAALRVRWIWLQKTDASKPWTGLEFKVLPEATVILNASVAISVGDGARIMFWEDPWIAGLNVESNAPAVLALVRPGLVPWRTV